MGLNNNILDFHTEVSKGLVPKHTLVHKFGHNLDIDTGTDPETVWSAGGLYTFPSSADTLKIISNDVDDNGTGTTGALTIKVQGLDANYDFIEEDFTLNGQTAVTGSKEFLRVFRAFVTSAGSSELNEGTITINNSDDSLTLAEIPAEHGQTQMAIYTIPRNHKAYLTSFSGSMSKAIPSSAIVLEVVFRENGIKRVKQNIAIDTTGSTSFIKYFKMPLPIEEKTDIIVNAKEVSQNNSGVFSNFALILVDQSDKYTTNV
tara:strand:+ start:1850 stop:2629 length:780 start_codon:yes stop_codon:yes gene_type:complete